MMLPAVSYPGAFFAGLLSFASPCVLPLVPAYISFLSGTSVQEAADSQHSSKTRLWLLLVAGAFVLGFMTIFVLLGASATFLSRLVAQDIGLLAKIAGVLIVIFGLHYLGIVRIPFLYYDARFRPAAKGANLATSFVLGLAFAFGWTPCVGPVLATILAVAAGSGSVAQGTGLLAIYGAGIGLPFLLAAVALGPFMRVMVRVRNKVQWVEKVAGALMIVTGILIFAGSLANVSGWLLRVFPGLSKVG